jgi:hypothetical protein
MPGYGWIGRGVPTERRELESRVCAGISTDDLRMGVVPRRVADELAVLLEDAMYAGECYSNVGKALEATWRDSRRKLLAAYREATQKGASDAV